MNIPVDDNPTRGAVAWWSAGSAGSSRGHVAWVQTVSDGAITIEEYNYLQAGMYDTRTISRSSSMWPSGFIHIKDTVVRNTVAPVVRGTAQVGQKVSTSNGKWSATNLVFHYQWLANGSPITGATTKSFQPTAAQLGQRLRAKVIATKSGSHTGSATSPPTDSVAQGVFTMTAGPVVSGTPQVGVQLSASNGTWSPAGTYTYHWFAGSTLIAGATASTFTPTAAELGQPIRVKVTSTLVGYTTQSELSDAHRPGRTGAVPRHRGAHDLRHAAGRPGPHRQPGHLDPGRQAAPAVAGRRRADRRRHQYDVRRDPGRPAQGDLAPGQGHPDRLHRRRRQLGGHPPGRTRHLPQHP